MTLLVGERYYHLIGAPFISGTTAQLPVIVGNPHAGNCGALLTALCVGIYFFSDEESTMFQGVWGFFFLPQFELDVGVFGSQDTVTWRQDLRPGVPSRISLSCLYRDGPPSMGSAELTPLSSLQPLL